MRGNVQRDDRPVGESKLRSYFSPFVHNDSNNTDRWSRL